MKENEERSDYAKAEWVNLFKAAQHFTWMYRGNNDSAMKWRQYKMAAARALLLVKAWSRIKTHADKDFIQTGAQLFFYLSGL